MRKRTGWGIIALFTTLVLLLASTPALAAPGDWDEDGVADEFDKWAKNPFSEPLDHLSVSDLSFTLDGARTALPAALYWELGNAASISVLSADIVGTDVLGTRVYSGPVFITKATVRNLATLDLDAEIMVGLTLNTNAKATAPSGGAFVRGDGICIAIRNVGDIVASLEAASGQTVTLFNLAQVVDQVKDVLSNLDLGPCSFALGVKNNGKLIEVLDQNNPFFPGIGRADRVTARIWGGVNFDLTGWRVPLRISLGDLLRFSNGRFSTEALTTSTATATTAAAPDPTALGTDDAVVTAEETTVDEAGVSDLEETTASEVEALTDSDLGTTDTETTDEEIAELQTTVVEIAGLESTAGG